MATRNIVPRADDEGGLGTSSKRWHEIHCANLYADSTNLHAGANKRIFSPCQMRMDDTNTGADSGTVFGIIDTVSFGTTEDGSCWAVMDFNDSDFSTDDDLIVDLTHVFNGDASGSEAVRLQIDCWVSDIGEAPSTGSPTVTQTSSLAVDTSTDNTIRETTSFMTISNGNFNTSTRTISFKVTRLPNDSNDTYGGSYNLIKMIARQ